MGTLKLWGTLGALVALASFIGWIIRIDHLRAGYKADIEATAQTVAKVGGVKPFKPDREHIAAAVTKIGVQRDAAAHDRDVYFGNWQASKSALADQTDRVIRLGDERKAAMAIAERAQAQVASLKAQRAGWIRQAQAASTRTERHAAEAEAAECEAAMNAVYRAGF